MTFVLVVIIRKDKCSWCCKMVLQRIALNSSLYNYNCNNCVIAAVIVLIE